MPTHDWSLVPHGIFHDFHHAWIESIKRILNARLLPRDYYALAEQFAAGYGPDVLTLQVPSGNGHSGDTGASPSSSLGGGVLLVEPRLKATAVASADQLLPRRKVVAVRHVSDDRIVAVVEIVSPGNKASANPLRSFVQKASELLTAKIHLLLVDLWPPGPRAPDGLHALIWEDLTGQKYAAPAGKPVSLMAYESEAELRAYVVHATRDEELTAMPLFLHYRGLVEVPLEETYRTAWEAVPQRWRRELEV